MQTIKGFTKDMVGKQYECGEDVYIRVYDLNKVSLVICGDEIFPSTIKHIMPTHMPYPQRRYFSWSDDFVLEDVRWN